MGNAWEMHGKCCAGMYFSGNIIDMGGFPASMELIRGAYKRILTRSHLLYLTIIRT
jgi:hypothetical protein